MLYKYCKHFSTNDDEMKQQFCDGVRHALKKARRSPAIIEHHLGVLDLPTPVFGGREDRGIWQLGWDTSEFYYESLGENQSFEPAKKYVRRNRMKIMVLSCIELLQHLDKRPIEKLAGVMEYSCKPPKHCFVKKGEKHENFYIVLTGNVLVKEWLYMKADKEYRDTPIRVLGPGEFIGAYELVTRSHMLHSYYTMKKVELLVLHLDSFQHTLHHIFAHLWLNLYNPTMKLLDPNMIKHQAVAIVCQLFNRQWSYKNCDKLFFDELAGVLTETGLWKMLDTIQEVDIEVFDLLALNLNDTSQLMYAAKHNKQLKSIMLHFDSAPLPVNDNPATQAEPTDNAALDGDLVPPTDETEATAAEEVHATGNSRMFWLSEISKPEKPTFFKQFHDISASYNLCQMVGLSQGVCNYYEHIQDSAAPSAQSYMFALQPSATSSTWKAYSPTLSLSRHNKRRRCEREAQESARKLRYILTSPLNDYSYMISVVRADYEYDQAAQENDGLPVSPLFEVDKSLMMRRKPTIDLPIKSAFLQVFCVPNKWIHRNEDIVDVNQTMDNLYNILCPK